METTTSIHARPITTDDVGAPGMISGEVFGQMLREQLINAAGWIAWIGMFAGCLFLFLLLFQTLKS